MENYTSFSSKAKLLIADDNKEILRQWQLFLRKSPVDYVTAENGLQATESFIEGNFYAAFLDINMPEMNGFEAAKIIKEINPNCYILAVSSRDSEEDLRLMCEAGFDEFMSKPFDIHEALEKVNCLGTLH